MVFMLLICSQNINAASASPLRGSTLGYTYVGNLTLTSTRVDASLSGEAEVSNEETSDAPAVRFTGMVTDINGNFVSHVVANGIKYCSFTATFLNGYYAECTYVVEGDYVGKIKLYV